MPLDNALQQGLDDDQIRKIAPSVFASHPAPSVSDRYAYIPTYPALRQMRLMGLVPVQVREARKASPEGKIFAMHEIRFRKAGEEWAAQTRELGQLTPEVLLRNSHDRTSPLSFSAGLHRLVCLNGMTVQEQGQSFKVRHVGRNTADQVHSGVSAIIQGFTKVIAVAERWSKIQMSPELRRRFATGALEARGTSLDVIDPTEILRARRTIDVGEDLWRVFNRAQEALTRGVRLNVRDGEGRPDFRAVRGIGSLTADVDFNRKLWALASDMAQEISPLSVSMPVVGS